MKMLVFMTCVFGASVLFFNNCSGGSSSSATSGSGSGSSININPVAIPYASPLPIHGNEANVMPVSVGCGYANEPCVSVTLCSPNATLGSSSCVTIPNVLLDTGSYGLRVFSDLIPAGVSLPAKTDSVTGHPLAECVSYLDGASDWGPVVAADVYLGNGNERAPGISVQVINANYASLPSGCTNPDLYSLASGNPNNVGFNGILGVGLFNEDCGDSCATDSRNQIYFSCSGSTCTGAAVPDSVQVSNPVRLISSLNSSGKSDNNGVILQMPTVSEAGATSLNGYLVLGIGTQSDNAPPSGVTVFSTDSYGNIQTYYNGQLFSDSTNYGAFIDSGSDGLYFEDNSIPQCNDGSGYFCPNSYVDLSAVLIPSNTSDTPQDQVPFQIANAQSELSQSNPNVVFDNLGGYLAGTFDWGFPFFPGKSIYVGIDGTSSSLGPGPYWGF